MKVSKGIVAVIVAAGLSMGMVACSSDEETVNDIVHDVSNSGTESTTESTNVTDTEPDLPKKVTGMSDNARKEYEKYSIPDEYIQSMLDEEIEVTKNFSDGKYGGIFNLNNNDLSMLISVDGEILDMVADPAAVHNGYFEPWAGRGR